MMSPVRGEDLPRATVDLKGMARLTPDLFGLPIHELKRGIKLGDTFD
jgi:hypothetical protein